MFRSASRSRERVRAWCALAAAAGLLALYGALVRGFAVGRSEFAYAPMINDGLPWSANRGFTWEQLFDHVYRLVLVGPAVVLASAAAYVLVPERLWTRARRPQTPARCAVLAAAGSLVWTAVMILVVFRGRAISDDEKVYRMQGAFLLDGRLTGRDVGYYPIDVFTIRTPLGYTGKYLFGEPLLQSVFTLVDRPALVHLPVVAVTFVAFYAAVRRAAGGVVAAWSVVFVALSPMVVMTSATGLSQATALACVALAGLGYTWTRTGSPHRGAILVGSAIGYALMTRPQTAIPVGAVVGIGTAWALLRRRDYAGLALLVAPVAAAALLVGAYDRALTGSPTRLPWFLQNDPELYGFGRIRRYTSFRHTLQTALENQLVTAIRFNAWWLGWPVGLGVFAVWWRLGRPRAGAGIWLAMGAAVVAFQAGYYGTGVSDTGPLYHYELVLPAAVLAAHTWIAAAARWPRAAYAVLFAHVVVGTGSFFVAQTARLHRLVTTIHHDSDAALARIHRPAVLFYETWGNESLSIGWVNEFPRRYRSDRDLVVTYPRPPASRVATVLAHYPGRECWYYHVDTLTERGDVRPCEEAAAFLNRRYVDESPSPWLWLQATAFKKTSFDPWAYVRADQATPGQPNLPPCSALDDVRATGDYVDDPCCMP